MEEKSVFRVERTSKQGIEERLKGKFEEEINKSDNEVLEVKVERPISSQKSKVDSVNYDAPFSDDNCEGEKQIGFIRKKQDWAKSRNEGNSLRDAFSQKISNHRNTEEQSLDKSRKQRHRKIYKMKKRNEAWLARPQPAMPNLTEEDQLIIRENIEKIKRSGKKYISIDTEMLFAKPDGSERKCKNYALWVTIVDENGSVLYESMARPTPSQVKDLGSRFHGLDWNTVKYSRNFNVVKT